MRYQRISLQSFIPFNESVSELSILCYSCFASSHVFGLASPRYCLTYCVIPSFLWPSSLYLSCAFGSSYSYFLDLSVIVNPGEMFKPYCLSSINNNVESTISSFLTSYHLISYSVSSKVFHFHSVYPTVYFLVCHPCLTEVNHGGFTRILYSFTFVSTNFFLVQIRFHIPWHGIYS